MLLLLVKHRCLVTSLGFTHKTNLEQSNSGYEPVINGIVMDRSPGPNGCARNLRTRELPQQFLNLLGAAI